MEPEFVIVLKDPTAATASAKDPEVVMDPEFVTVLEDPVATTPTP
jgi:hypothetical protein